MKNHLIIHGHFYQPPREDPWTGLIPNQASAHPHHDWNARINRECYMANGASRTLNPMGKVSDIVNNYEFLSFNFGPTLLNWLKEYSTEAYDRIILADRISAKRNNGHGNAMAQSYNHTILPLSTAEDARCQIIWGLRDFEAHFGREAEGMWLPEAGVNMMVVDLLIREKVKFIVLSPWQGEAICRVGSSRFQTLSTPVPSGRAYKIERPEGSLAVFFYNPDLAAGISFEHYLRNADQLYDRFMSFRQAADESYLINVATDGEIYGHHEPFGDMCLSAFSKIVSMRDDFVFTNYGRYLEEHPPEYLVKLREGEEGRGSSWSCVHGVSRWYRNCGCTTGGEDSWNQEWRTPLRQSLQHLQENLQRIFIKHMSTLSSRDAMEVRNLYIDVLNGKSAKEDFAKEIINKKNPKDKSAVNLLFTLLEGQKFAMYMFTSCGWFFSEISGLEATQNMKYAIKALDLYSKIDDTKELLSAFLLELENARSNIHSFGSGRNILESMIIPTQKGLEYGASLFALSQLGKIHPFEQDEYGLFTLINFKRENSEESEKTITHKGSLTIQDNATLNEAVFEFELKEKELEGLFLKLKDISDKENPQAALEIHQENFPLEVRDQIVKLISRQVVNSCIQESMETFYLIRNALTHMSVLNVKRPSTIIELSELIIDRLLEDLLEDPEAIPSEEELDQIKSLVTFAHEKQLSIDTDSLKLKISNMIKAQAQKLAPHIPSRETKLIITLLELCRNFQCEPETTFVQNQVFRLIRELDDKTIDQINEDKNFEALSKLRRLIKMGEVLGIDVDHFKEKFFSL
ncbi:MAG: DUF3536 domain-containing protein [Spirochaetales bacterium]|nr:DUF3536 domain-containing protein [Spirochaetales bacterium]